uniref:Uncharacterized protein n=1 Tax=Arundo donax TaxID=35708 RepID=A0A0A8ZAP5_ARUDO
MEASLQIECELLDSTYHLELSLAAISPSSIQVDSHATYSTCLRYAHRNHNDHNAIFS